MLGWTRPGPWHGGPGGAGAELSTSPGKGPALSLYPVHILNALDQGRKCLLALLSNPTETTIWKGKKRGKKFFFGILLPPKAKRPCRLIANTNPYLAAVLCRTRHAGLILVSVM